MIINWVAITDNLFYCVLDRTMATTKASKVATSLKKGSGRKSTKVHHNTHFFKPKTQQLARNPQYVRKSAPKSRTALAKAYDVIKFPLATETAMQKMTNDNTLCLICDVKATKAEIKRAVKLMYDITVEKINTLIRPDGTKKAFVKLTSDLTAQDVANRLGVL